MDTKFLNDEERSENLKYTKASQNDLWIED